MKPYGAEDADEQLGEEKVILTIHNRDSMDVLLSSDFEKLPCAHMFSYLSYARKNKTTKFELLNFRKQRSNTLVLVLYPRLIFEKVLYRRHVGSSNPSISGGGHSRIVPS